MPKNPALLEAGDDNEIKESLGYINNELVENSFLSKAENNGVAVKLFIFVINS